MQNSGGEKSRHATSVYISHTGGTAFLRTESDTFDLFRRNG